MLPRGMELCGAVTWNIQTARLATMLHRPGLKGPAAVHVQPWPEGMACEGKRPPE